MSPEVELLLDFAAKRPEPSAAAVIVDVTPSVTRSRPVDEHHGARHGRPDRIGGSPCVRDAFEEMAPIADIAQTSSPCSRVARPAPCVEARYMTRTAVEPTTASGRGAHPPGGRCTRRSTRQPAHLAGRSARTWVDFTPMWDDVSTITVPTMLVRGGESKFVLDEDVAEFQQRLPSVRYEVVPGAGHAVQSDQPLVLVALIEAFAFGV
jgi:pimeloyl-ACP methyl ester carboxylesterase